MEPGSPSPWSAPGPTPGTSPLRWGLGDFFGIYFAGLIAAQIGGAIALAVTGPVASSAPIPALLIGLIFGGQYLTWIGGLVLVSRVKGRAGLREDFGLDVRARRMWALLVGLVLQFVLGVFVLPLIALAHYEKEGVVQDLARSSGAARLIFLVGAGLFAPVTEELLFRGLLLRALRRRYSPEVAIAVSAVLFGAAHLIGGGVLGTLAILPALVALGMISGVAAVWVGDLSVSIPLHVGFNLITLASYAVIRH